MNNEEKTIELAKKLKNEKAKEWARKNKDKVSEAMKSIKADITSPIDFCIGAAKSRVNAGNRQYNAGGGSSQNNTTYTFNQYNNSPKPLSRLEIYRQTKNQLNFAKGV